MVGEMRTVGEERSSSQKNRDTKRYQRKKYREVPLYQNAYYISGTGTLKCGIFTVFVFFN